MPHLSRDDLMPLEVYSEQRAALRAKVIAHKRARRVALGEHASLYFEDELTMRYQIQEMLHVERIFEAAGIQQELDTYNPLIPDGGNWKATFMIEYPDKVERQAALTRLVGVEHAVWVRVGQHPQVYAVADEDLPRSTDDRTSAVHFMRFELTPAMIADAKAGSPIALGCRHDNLSVAVDPVDEATRRSLLRDLR